MQARLSYLDYLLAENEGLTEEQLLMLIWEVILEAAVTTLVATEWAMYKVAKNPEKQASTFQTKFSIPRGNEKQKLDIY